MTPVCQWVDVPSMILRSLFVPRYTAPKLRGVPATRAAPLVLRVVDMHPGGADVDGAEQASHAVHRAVQVDSRVVLADGHLAKTMELAALTVVASTRLQFQPELLELRYRPDCGGEPDVTLHCR